MCQRSWWRYEPKIRDVVGDGLVLVAVWPWLCGWGDGVEGVKWLVCWVAICGCVPGRIKIISDSAYG